VQIDWLQKMVFLHMKLKMLGKSNATLVIPAAVFINTDIYL